MKEDKPMSFIERMKQTALTQKCYGGEAEIHAAGAQQAACPNCGASRTKNDGLTHCAYCGHAFIETTLTNGRYINKEDNSR